MPKRTQTDILGAILETLDLIQLGFEKMNQPEETKKGKKSKKTKQSSDNKSELSMNSSFDVLENIKIDKQKAQDMSVFVCSLKTLSTIDNKKLEKNINSAVKLVEALGKIKIDGPKLYQSIGSLAPIISSIAQLAEVNILKLWTAMSFLTEGNAKRIGNFIKAIIDSLKDIKVKKDLAPLSNFTKGITDVLTLFTDKTKQYNPAQGLIRGWMISLYFSAIKDSLIKVMETFAKALKPFNKEMLSQLSQLTTFIDRLLDIRILEVIRLNIALRSLSLKGAATFYVFTKTLLDSVPEGDKGQQKVENLKILFEALSSLKVMSIMNIWLAGKLLDETIGDNIGKCLESLINKVPTEKKVQNFQTTMKSLTKAMLTMTGLLVVLTVLAHWDWKALLIGLGALAGVMLLLVGFLYALSFKSIQTALKETSKNLLLITTSVLLMVAAMGLIVLLSTFGDKINWLAVLSIFVGLTAIVGIMWLMTKVIKEYGKDLMMGVLAIIVLLGGISIIVNTLIIPMGEQWKAALNGSLVVIGIITAIGFMMWTLGEIVEKTGSVMKKGALYLLAIAGILWILSIAMIPWMLIMKSIADLSAEDVAIKSGIMIAIIASFGALAVGFGYLSKIVGLKTIILGGVILAGIGGLIWLMTKTLTPYFEMMNMLKDLSWKEIGIGSAKVAAVIAGFGVLITGLGALSFIPGFKTLLGIGVVIMGLISGVIYAVSKTIGEFINVVNKAAELNPKTINGFIDALVGDDRRPGLVEAIRKTISALSSIGLWASIKAKYISRMISPIFTAVGKFVDILVQMANGQYVKEYDKDGKPIYGQITNEMYQESAIVISEGFARFIDALSEACDGLGRRTLKAMKKLGESINPIMTSIGSFANAILLLAAGTYTDPDGKQQRLIKKDYENAAEVLTQSFMAFVTKLGEMDGREIYVTTAKIKQLINGDIGELVDSTKTISDALVNMAKIAAESKIDLVLSARTISSAISTFFNGLRITTDLDDLEDGVDAIKHAEKISLILIRSFNDEKAKKILGAITNYGTSFKMLFSTINDVFEQKQPNYKSVKNIITDMTRLFDLLKNIDKQLIDKQYRRVEAIRRTTDSIKKLGDELEKVNNGLQQNIQLKNEQQRITQNSMFEWAKSINPFSQKLTETKTNDSVANATDTGTATNQPTNARANANVNANNKQTSEQDLSQLAAIISQSITAGMNQWIRTHKSLVIELDAGGNKQIIQGSQY